MLNRRTLLGTSTALAAAGMSQAGAQQRGEPLRIALIDPMSGLLANAGDGGLKHMQFAAEKVNDRGGVLGGRRLEVAGFDGKANAQESVTQLRAVIDQGIRVVVQGNGTHVALALIEAIERHNQRNPGQEVIYLNYAAVDPVLTNERCSYWHFQFDANSAMKLKALTSSLSANRDLKRLYLINQDYAFGRGVAKEAEALMKEVRPDVEIVGSDLHPLGRVTDFSPYVAKIQQSGAQAVLTGNWGSDLSLLVRAAGDAGLNAGWYTFYAGAIGTPAAIGASGVGKVRIAVRFHDNLGYELNDRDLSARTDEFRKKYGIDFYAGGVFDMFAVFAHAVNQAGSADMKKVAAALSGASIPIPGGTLQIRPDNHQAEAPFYVAVLDRGVKLDAEGIGAGWRTEAKFAPDDLRMPTSCRMRTPA